jgi:poly-gamma-glutamate capsule biosynthesis protein CapA/YwtB (metallophosphatase superfamily)
MNKRAFVACPFFFKQHVVINTVRILLIAPLLFLGCTSKPVTIKLLFTGDLMLDRGIRKAIAVNGVDYLFEGVKPLFMQQDYVIANFEGTVCDSELTASSKAFCFRAAPEWMPKLFENGITTVSLANNHSGDYGQVGLYQTAQYLHNNKIATMGYNETNDPCAAFIIEKNGVKLAIFSSSFLYDKDSSSICHESDDLLCNRIQSFKKEHTGYQIILCLHWGIEMKQSPEAKQVTQAHALSMQEPT